MKTTNESIDKNKTLEYTMSKINEHPLKPEDIVSIVLRAWEGLLKSEIGSKPCKIGIDILPKPQLIGSLLHELIPIEANLMFPDKWRVDKNKSDKDLVYIEDDMYSIKIKTSSSSKNIFGNRSYAKSIDECKLREGYFMY